MLLDSIPHPAEAAEAQAGLSSIGFQRTRGGVSLRPALPSSASRDGPLVLEKTDTEIGHDRVPLTSTDGGLPCGGQLTWQPEVGGEAEGKAGAESPSGRGGSVSLSLGQQNASWMIPEKHGPSADE